MTYAERVEHWNRVYDQAPEHLRFQIVVWGVVALGAINMLLTVGTGFPFGLLVILAVALLTTVRLPHALGWVRQPEAGAALPARIEIQGADGLVRLNRWYDRLPELQQTGVLMVVLLGAGAINMLLTFNSGFPFGLLFLVAVLALVVIRGPYAAGWLKLWPDEPMLDTAPPAPRLQQDPALGQGGMPPVVEHRPAAVPTQPD